eukprot:s114_g53.t1
MCCLSAHQWRSSLRSTTETEEAGWAAESRVSSAEEDNDSDKGGSASRARRRGRCKTNNQDTGKNPGTLAKWLASLRPRDDSAEEGSPARRAKLTRASTANFGGKPKAAESSLRQEFLDEHPGGPDVVTALAGKDGTQDFEDISHSDSAREWANKLVIGYMEGAGEEEEELKIKRIPKHSEAAKAGGASGIGAFVPAGFAETKLDITDTSPKTHLSKKSAALEKPAESDAESHKVPPLPQRTLPGGFTVGERAVTLISRESQSQSLMMELGQEGNIVGAVERRHGGEVDLRLLVQFPKGVNWWLAPSQLSQPAQFGAARAAGIYGFSWGARVRSLVTLFKLPSTMLTMSHGATFGSTKIEAASGAAKTSREDVAVSFPDATLGRPSIGRVTCQHRSLKPSTERMATPRPVARHLASCSTSRFVGVFRRQRHHQILRDPFALPFLQQRLPPCTALAAQWFGTGEELEPDAIGSCCCGTSKDAHQDVHHPFQKASSEEAVALRSLGPAGTTGPQSVGDRSASCNDPD